MTTELLHDNVNGEAKKPAKSSAKTKPRTASELKSDIKRLVKREIPIMEFRQLSRHFSLSQIFQICSPQHHHIVADIALDCINYPIEDICLIICGSRPTVKKALAELNNCQPFITHLGRFRKLQNIIELHQDNKVDDLVNMIWDGVLIDEHFIQNVRDCLRQKGRIVCRKTICETIRSMVVQPT